MKIIIGLGNPGEQYKKTRHNAGFMAVDAMARQAGENWQFNKKFNAETTSPQPSPYKGEGEKKRLILIKPHTTMNNSGQAVQAIMSYYNLLPKKLGLVKAKNSNLADVLTVIHDDIDIELGKYKVSVDSRSAGHRGVGSIIQHLKTKNFKRTRIGIRTELTGKMPADKFVLERFRKEEQKVINSLINESLLKL